jgi:hypothetical protein
MPKIGQQESKSDADSITSADIKKAMIDAGVSTVELATSIGRSRDAVTKAIYHPSVVPGVRLLVLKKLKPFLNA